MAKNISVTIKFWKQNGPKEKGHFDTHELKNIPDDTSFLEALDIMNEELIEAGKEPFVFDHDCREGICGMCSLYINGTPHGKTERGATTCQLYMRRFKEGDTIKGLTTAAGIWSTAAIGLAIGGGMYFISIFVTVFVILFMVIVSKSPLAGSRDNAVDYKLIITVAAGTNFHKVITDKAEELKAQVTKMKIAKNKDGSVTYTFTLHMTEAVDTSELATFIEEHNEVINISANEQ